MLYEWGENLSDTTRFVDATEDMTREMAETLLEIIRAMTPTETGRLVAGWDGNDFLIENTDTGYSISLVNTVPYANAVNNGHMVYNQYGGPWEVKKRVKVPVPHEMQADKSSYFVYGHFFVERSILMLENSTIAEKILRKHLEQWWEDLFND